jgi:hypothetical protein
MATSKLSRDEAAVIASFRTGLRAGREELFDALDQTIRAAAPKLAVERSGKMLAYGPFHYRYESGREGDAHAVAIMDGAQAISVYVMGYDDGVYLAESFAERLGKVAVGKSCIRVKRVGDLDLEAFDELIRAVAQRHQAGTLLLA